jgi:hypothetical protein
VSSIELRVDGEGAPGATSDGSGACPAMTQAGVGEPRSVAPWSRGEPGHRQVGHGHNERRRRFPFGLNSKLKQIQISSNLIKL